MKSIGNSHILKLSETPPATISLPVVGSPAKIVITGEMTAVINIYVSGDFYWTVAKTDGSGATRIANASTRGTLPAGFYNFEVSGNHDDNLYIASQGLAVAGGISYSISEFV